jgi:hypothetical protein
MYIYNVMGTPRRIEHCGEINVKCSNGVSCTLVFPKVISLKISNLTFTLNDLYIKRRIIRDKMNFLVILFVKTWLKEKYLVNGMNHFYVVLIIQQKQYGEWVSLTFFCKCVLNL